mmetsp:Transcript_80594/g.207445  ORF Transcript_80594/g.207445 Transcript_80594/m.207445 type:complete len:114 (-) Transcript_80594:463-804(-)
MTCTCVAFGPSAGHPASVSVHALHAGHSRSNDSYARPQAPGSPRYWRVISSRWRDLHVIDMPLNMQVTLSQPGVLANGAVEGVAVIPAVDVVVVIVDVAVIDEVMDVVMVIVV